MFTWSSSSVVLWLLSRFCSTCEFLCMWTWQVSCWRGHNLLTLPYGLAGCLLAFMRIYLFNASVASVFLCMVSALSYEIMVCCIHLNPWGSDVYYVLYSNHLKILFSVLIWNDCPEVWCNNWIFYRLYVLFHCISYIIFLSILSVLSFSFLVFIWCYPSF